MISPTIATVNLGSITQIDGNIQIVNNGSASSTLAATTSFVGSSLQSITGTMTLTELTQLNSLAFPSLASVGGISFTTLPVLSSLGFGALTSASTIMITDTQLESLSGINLERADTISITNNKYLATIAMSTLTEVGTTLLISANAAGLEVSFPVLANCGNFTVQQVGNLSINALANVTGSMGIQQTTLTLIQANNLTKITQDLFITNNTDLLNISMPLLQTVSGFQIANNTLLLDIDFPSLTTVGAVDLTGDFKTLELPLLTRVEGGVNVQTTATGFTCPISQSKVSSTSFVCKGAVASPQKANSTSSSSTTTTSSGSSTSTTSSSKSGANMVSSGFAGVIVAALALAL